MTSEPPLPIEHLLAQSDWVTRLARVLVRDPATADDVVQATWLDVLRTPPRASVRLREWLAAVVRRKAQRFARTAARRDRRERVAAAAQAGRTAPSAADLAARVATHRELVDAVLALDEPYRETVVLRFFENLDLAAIGERTQSKLNTVRSRLQRGLQNLRERLDRTHGGRQRWLPAVLVLGRRELASEAVVGAGGMAAGIALAITMKKLVLFAAAAAAAVLFTLPWLQPDAPGAVPVGRAAAATAAAAPSPDHPAEAPAVAADAMPRVAVPSVATAGAARRVVDRDGRPLAGVVVRAESPHAVRWQGGDRGWISGADRSLRIAPAEEERLLADPAYAQQFFAGFEHADEWRATVLGTALPTREVTSDAAGGFTFPAGLGVADAAVTIGDPAFVLVAAGRSGERPWVAAPATRAAGVVRDEQGTPLADTFVLPLCALADGVVELAQQLESRTDDDGRFLCRKAAANGVLRVRREGYETAFVPLADRPQQELAIVLRRKTATVALQLEGLVVDGSGRPIAAAAVWFGRQRTLTGADGRFAVPADNPQPQYALTIVAKGYALFQQDGLGAALTAAGPGQPDRLFVLTKQPLAARGVVLGSDGAPLAGALVGLLDPTLLDLSFEGVEARVGGWSGGVATGSDGTFALAGLGDRAYRFRAVDPATGAVVTSAPHRAEAGDLVLRLPRDLRRNVRGTVQIDGQPAAGATVEIGYCTHITKGGGTQFDGAPAVACDGDGRFVLPVLPRQTAWLGVRVDGSLRHMVPVESLPEGDEVLVAVDGRRWLQLVGSAFPVARPIHFELDDGRVVASGASLTADGDAPPLPIPAAAVAVVLAHGGPAATRQLLTEDRAVLLRVR